MTRAAVWMCGLSLAAHACGGSQKSAEDASGGGSESFGAAGTPWSQKTREQRMDWMGLEVFPKMRAVFVEYDAEKFSSFACQTCHGNNMEMIDFKMPNETIFALSKTDTLTKARDYDAKVTDFMADSVVPAMAKLLDSQPYDPETNTGFGCFNCHTAED